MSHYRYRLEKKQGEKCPFELEEPDPQPEKNGILIYNKFNLSQNMWVAIYIDAVGSIILLILFKN
jgi:hypothetical protein